MTNMLIKKIVRKFFWRALADEVADLVNKEVKTQITNFVVDRIDWERSIGTRVVQNADRVLQVYAKKIDELEAQAAYIKPVGWITKESLLNLDNNGGNSKGTVPIHKNKSNTANIEVFMCVGDTKIIVR